MDEEEERNRGGGGRGGRRVYCPCETVLCLFVSTSFVSFYFSFTLLPT